MVVHKKKKVTKYRGNSTHGGGARKKRRGAGSRGGRGNAGTGKRAGQKKAGRPCELGSFGFNPRHGVTSVCAVNVGYFTPRKVQTLVEMGKAVKEGSLYVIDLEKLGYEKLLGAGIAALKLKLLVSQCSVQAAEKVKAAGGEVICSVSSA